MASYEVEISQDAEADLEDILAWYRQQNTEGLTDYFLAQVRIKLSQLAQHPFSATQWDNTSYRVAMIPRFPYRMFFAINESAQTIRVLAVLHQRRNPDYVRSKMRQRP